MSESKENVSKGKSALDRTHRFSLQQKQLERDLPPGALRHTQSHRYESDGKRKTKKSVVLTPIPSVISENSEEDGVIEEKAQKVKDTLENGGRASKISNVSKSSMAFVNLAYDSNMDGRSISSRAGSSRQPSVQSLEVVREQYCCCAKRTKCERKLLIAVAIMSITIIVLVIVLVVITTNHDIKEDLRIAFRL